jgi:DNA-binding transcriptional LysR family regulator
VNEPLNDGRRATSFKKLARRMTSTCVAFDGRPRLLIPQTTRSRCVRPLDERIEIIVFEPSSSRVRVTQLASDFLCTARSILEQTDTLMANASSAGRGEDGRLAIGF